MTKHIRLNHDKTYTKKSWQNIYDEVMTKHLRSLRWRSLDKTYTMKKSWKFMRWEKRWEKRWDLTTSPKIYFWIIYAHYDEKVLTKHLRWNHDKTFTMRSWQNIYEEIMTKHLCYTVMLVMNVCPTCWR